MVVTLYSTLLWRAHLLVTQRQQLLNGSLVVVSHLLHNNTAFQKTDRVERVNNMLANKIYSANDDDALW